MQPFVSVVIPIKNEASFIKNCLTSVINQNYPKDRFEIIIADGNSNDNSKDIINNLKKSTSIPIKIINNPEGIAPTALNLAIKQATGEIIIRVDGHTIIELDYVSQCVSALIRTNASNVGGRMNAFSEKKFGQVVALATSSRFGIGNSRFHYSEREEYVDSVYLGAWRKEVFDKYGLFNEQLIRNQDDEFNYRLRAHGCKILLCPQIKSRYYNRTSIKNLWRQYYQYGYWKVRILQLHPLQMSLRQFIPFIFILSLLMTGGISIFSILGRWGFILILSAYLAVNLISSLIISVKTRGIFFPFLFLSFAILHFSYGLGFFVGLISFRNYWGNTPQNEPFVPKP